MIRINLHPEKKNRREEEVRREMRVVGLGALVVAILLGVFHGVALARTGAISSANAALQSDISTKQEIVKEIKAAEEVQADLQKRLQVIKQLKANKSGPVRMLDELAMATPDKLQMTSLTEKDGQLKLTGIAVSNEVISQFLSNLEQSAYFTDVFLNAIDQTETEGVKLKSYSITARLVVLGVGSDEPPPPSP